MPRWRFRLLLAAAALAFAALLLSSGGERTVSFRTAPALQQASAELEVDGDKATLVANRLPAPPEGEAYMVWLKRPGNEAPEPSVAGVDDAEAVLVNTEQPGGAAEPTSAVLMTATLS